MKKFIIFLLLCFVASTQAVPPQVVEFDVLKAIYKGDGEIDVVNDSGMYDVRITGMGNLSNKNSLTILPQSGRQKAPNFTHINLIYADGPLKKIQVKFPPGKGERSSYIRNISVSGSVDTISIEGGDLGSADHQDGNVYIGGNVKSITLKGKKYKNNLKVLEWWGGDIWANIEINGFLQKLLVKGGNINLDSQGCVPGKIVTHGDIKQIIVKGTPLKNENGDQVLYGGGVCAEINTNERELNKLLIKGGIFIGGKINCQQLKSLKVIGQDSLNPKYEPLSFTKHGIFNSQILSFNSGTLPSDMINITVKNGAIHDNIFTAYGDIKTVKVTGKTGFLTGSLSNTIVRAGLNGDLSINTAPKISPEIAETDLPVNGKIVVPFSVTSDNPNEKLTIYIDNYEKIYDTIISNYSGQTFSSTNRWKGTSPMYGMFVCDSTAAVAGVIVRALDNGTPFKYSDMTVNIGGMTTNAAPSISLSPSDNPREINSTETNDFSWEVTITDNNANQPVTFSLEDDTIGLTISNLSQRNFIVSAEKVPLGIYSNIIFKVVDDGGLSASKSVTVIVTNIYTFSVRTTLDNTTLDWPVNSNLTFDVIASDKESTSLEFLDVDSVIPNIIYSNAVFSGTIATNHFSWQPTLADAGIKNFEFKVLNSNGDTSSVIVVVNIELPEIKIYSSLSSTNFSWFAGNFLNFYIIAKDVKTNNYEFITPDYLPTSSSYVQTPYDDVLLASNEFTWTPNNDDKGTHELIFPITTNGGVAGYVYVTIEVCTKEPFVSSALPGDQKTILANENIKFHIIGEMCEKTDLIFLKPSNFPAGANYDERQYNNVYKQSNDFIWTPVISQTGEWKMTFPVVNSDALEGAVDVIINVTTSSGLIINSENGWTELLEPRADDATFKVANINSISCVGDAYDNYFICGLKQDDIFDTNWSNQYTIYQGRVKRVKIKEKATRNTIVSEKKISASKEDSFYTNNFIWINGQKATDSKQKFN